MSLFVSKTQQKFHFIGIGGVSMSGLALNLHKKGFTIQGSDSRESNVTKELEKQGIKVFIGHKEDQISPDINLVIKTSTVPENNPEVIRAKELQINIINRFDLLSDLVNTHSQRIGIVGAHGKTTTTSLTWHAFKKSNLDPSVFVGSILQELNSSTYESISKKYCIVETDESDGSFAKMDFEHGIITNIHNDHLEFYDGKLENLYAHFRIFANKILKQNGYLLIGTDYELSSQLYKDIKNDSVFSYSNKPKTADFYPLNISRQDTGMQFDLYFRGTPIGTNISIPFIGNHNIDNACMALSLLYLLNQTPIKHDILTDFSGVEKRMTILGKYYDFTIIDDYAHHPSKINALIKSIEDYGYWDKIIYVCEPHKYSRVTYLYNDFIEAFNAIKNPSSELHLMEIFGVAGGLVTGITNKSFYEDVKKAYPNIKIEGGKSNDEILNNLTERISLGYYKDAKKGLVVFFGAGLSSTYAKKMKISLAICTE